MISQKVTEIARCHQLIKIMGDTIAALAKSQSLSFVLCGTLVCHPLFADGAVVRHGPLFALAGAHRDPLSAPLDACRGPQGSLEDLSVARAERRCFSEYNSTLPLVVIHQLEHYSQ